MTEVHERLGNLIYHALAIIDPLLKTTGTFSRILVTILYTFFRFARNFVGLIQNRHPIGFPIVRICEASRMRALSLRMEIS